MRVHKPIEAGDTITFKYCKENVDSHKDNPQWYPKIGTKGYVIQVHDDILIIQWKLESTSIDDLWRIEKYRVQRYYGGYKPRGYKQTESK